MTRALAERLLNGSGEDRELDAVVHYAVTGSAARYGGAGPMFGMLVVRTLAGWQPLPRYTTSLDAALTLYPSLPDRIPSNPRAAAAEALMMRDEGE